MIVFAFIIKRLPIDLLSLLAECQHDHHVDVLFPDHAPVVVNGGWQRALTTDVLARRVIALIDNTLNVVIKL